MTPRTTPKLYSTAPVIPLRLEPMPRSDDKTHAQARVNQIAAFRKELEILEREHGLALSTEQRELLGRVHGATLADLTGRFDVDATVVQRQLSMGMRIASLLGAIAFSAAIFLFFYRIWGLLPTWLQVALLVGAPVGAVLLAAFAAKRERTLYFTAVAAIVAFAAFVLDLTVLAQIFNLVPTPHAFLAWAVFGLALAHAYELRLLFAAGLASAIAWLAALLTGLIGEYWTGFSSRPEMLLVPGAVVFGIYAFPRSVSRSGLSAAGRVTGAAAVFLAILVLGFDGWGSLLPLDSQTTEALYEGLGFVVAGLAIYAGIRRSWPEVTNTGVAAFVLYLFVQAFDWWWDWMPRYLFFLVLGLLAVLVISALKRLRSARQERVA